MTSWRWRIVLSVLVVIQAGALLALLAMYVVAPSRAPFPLIFVIGMTALLVSAGILVVAIELTGRVRRSG